MGDSGLASKANLALPSILSLTHTKLSGRPADETLREDAYRDCKLQLRLWLTRFRFMLETPSSLDRHLS
jgi:hypothetical protein